MFHKKLFAMLGIAALIGFLFAGCSNPSSSSGGGGTGGGDTGDGAFEVWTAADLMNVGRGMLSGQYAGWDMTAKYKQMADINMTGQNWNPIINTFSGGVFTGTYDGNNKTINNITINSSRDSNLGLFYTIGAAGLVKNVKLTNCTINAWGDVGGIAATNTGTIQNCSVTGAINCSSNPIGGIAGTNTSTGTIENCFSLADVNGDQYIGGMVGSNGGTVKNSYSTGNITGDGGNTGGVVGLNYGIVQNCYSTGDINASLEAGGIVGVNNSNGIIKNCFATGIIKVRSAIYNTSAGGISGTNGGVIQNCAGLNSSVTAGTTQYSYAGRVVRITEGTLENNYGLTGMTVENYNGAVIVSSNLAGLHGADVSQAQTATSTWWTTAGNWNDTGWDFTNIWYAPSGSTLPTLRNVGGTQDPEIQ